MQILSILILSLTPLWAEEYQGVEILPQASLETPTPQEAEIDKTNFKIEGMADKKDRGISRGPASAIDTGALPHWNPFEENLQDHKP